MKSSGAVAWIAAAAPVHLLLALATDLSPDEAYYLCAARRGHDVLVDHPPLLPWLLRATDGIRALPVEARVRVWPMLTSLGIAAACAELARRRGADDEGRAVAACLAAWSLLPMAGGFVATPDGPALLACAALLVWGASPHPSAALESSRDGDRAGGAVALLAAVLGSLAKVVVVPVALLTAAGARARPRAWRAAVAAASLVTLPLLWRSLRFQREHALEGAGVRVGVGAALAAAITAQALLWSPWVLARGVVTMARPGWPMAHRGLVVLFTGLVAASAVSRGVPPEPNWWAPAALLLVVAAACSAAELAPRRRAFMLATAVVPTLLAAAHTVRPFLPLPPSVDPTARLHGWSSGKEPLAAVGVGPYGAAAERCIYRNECADIDRHFEEMRANW